MTTSWATGPEVGSYGQPPRFAGGVQRPSFVQRWAAGAGGACDEFIERYRRTAHFLRQPTLVTQICTHCGAPIPDGARFCPRCGVPVELAEPESPVDTTPPELPPPQPRGTAAPQPEVGPAAPRRRASGSGVLIGVLIALVALGLVIWALLAGMPFGHRTAGGRLDQTESAQPDVITEQQGGTATVSQIVEPGGVQPTDTTPTMMTPTMTMPPTTSMPPITMPPTESMPYPPPAPAAPSGPPLSEDEAVNIVRGYVTANNYYATTSDCVGVVPMEHENAGYTVDVVDRCGDRGRLGRWRVDEVTREIFVRRADGRYLRP